MSKETFKSFARLHPELATSVQQKTTTWQQLYELYEIYGETSPVWNNYLTQNTITDNISNSATTFKEFINTFKNIDMDAVQKSITNIQKTIGLLQDIGINNNPATYEAKPIYKRFED